MRKSWFFVFLHMLKKGGILICFFFALVINAQEVQVPVDLRQHNLIDYNASLFNPVLSLDGDTSQSIAFWTRWQWQQIDADPTTLFLNYSRKLSEESAAGLGFFQHNTGVYVNTGALLNYAYFYSVNDDLRIGLGLNLFGFKQVLADTRLLPDPDFPLPGVSTTNDFILQAAPGILLKWKDLQIGLTSENLFDYNFARKERQSNPEERIYLMSGGYDFKLFSGNSVLRPMLYYKSVPAQNDQYGLNTIFSARRYWVQAGYNNFYGVSVGAGGKFLRKLSIGALMEFATDASLDGKDASFEVVAAYQFGKRESEEREVPKQTEELIVETNDEDENEDENIAAVVENTETDKSEERERLKSQRRQEKEALQAEKLALQNKEAEERLKAKEIAIAERERETAERLRQQQRNDSIANAKLSQRLELDQQKTDSLNLIEAERIQRKEAELATQQKSDSIKRATAESAENLVTQRKLMDSLSNLNAERIRRKEAAVAAQKRLDSMNNLRAVQVEKEVSAEKEQVVVQKDEKYEEVKTEDGLQAGFYLIANVFGTKTYYNAFMEDLGKKGLNPKSFLRSLNNYQYVYLERYDTMAEARQARNSKFFGKYPDKTWIFRVVGE